jgi:hypothetical protein
VVWALPRSIATTKGITFVFSSSAYLDVSVQQVCPVHCTVSLRMGCPIRKSPDQGVFATPRCFSQLITSFFASESLGIPRTPLLTFFRFIVLKLVFVVILFPTCQRSFACGLWLIAYGCRLCCYKKNRTPFLNPFVTSFHLLFMIHYLLYGR